MYLMIFILTSLAGGFFRLSYIQKPQEVFSCGFYFSLQHRWFDIHLFSVGEKLLFCTDWLSADPYNSSARAALIKSVQANCWPASKSHRAASLWLEKERACQPK